MGRRREAVKSNLCSRLSRYVAVNRLLILMLRDFLDLKQHGQTGSIMATAQKIKLRAYEKAFKHELYNIAYLLFYSLRAHFSGPPANEIF